MSHVGTSVNCSINYDHRVGFWTIPKCRDRTNAALISSCPKFPMPQ